MAAEIVRTIEEVEAMMRDAEPPTPDDVPIDLDGTPLDTREKLAEWAKGYHLALAEARARGEYVGRTHLGPSAEHPRGDERVQKCKSPDGCLPATVILIGTNPAPSRAVARRTTT